MAANMLNVRVVPFFVHHDLKLMRMLADRETEYCGNRETHEYEPYLAIEDIDHAKIKAKNPQTNDICERFNRTVQSKSDAIAFRNNCRQPPTLGRLLQHLQNTFRKILFWKNTHADLHRKH